MDKDINVQRVLAQQIKVYVTCDSDREIFPEKFIQTKMFTGSKNLYLVSERSDCVWGYTLSVITYLILFIILYHDNNLYNI